MKIAVAGGTGVVGRHLVEVLRERGHEPAVLSRSLGVDVATGQGVAAALARADAVVDVTGTRATRRRAATAFFTSGTRHLLEHRRGPHVLLSIVGVDQVPFGYYRAKTAQEGLVLAAGGTVLRTTQFHEFAGQLLDRTPGPVAVVPRARVQPVAAREVAEALADLVEAPVAGRAQDLAGPEVHQLVDLARQVVRARGQRRRVLPAPLPARTTAALLAGPDARIGTTRFADVL